MPSPSVRLAVPATLAATASDSLRAQTITPATTITPASGPAVSTAQSDALIKLNPFEVKTEADNSYSAPNSNSLTQFNTALNKTPAPPISSPRSSCATSAQLRSRRCSTAMAPAPAP